MTDQKGSNNKLQDLIERFGGWATLALLTLVCYMYQADRVQMQNAIENVEKSVAVNVRAINRLQEGKVSREEFKNVQEAWIRETQGLRQDVRDLTNSLRLDLKNTKQ
jgi:hypothetical protein